MTLLHVVELLTWAGWSAFAVAVAVRLTRAVVRRDRATVRDRVARPLLDGAAVEAALQGLPTTSSHDLVVAMDLDTAARRDRTSLLLDVDPALAPEELGSRPSGHVVTSTTQRTEEETPDGRPPRPSGR